MEDKPEWRCQIPEFSLLEQTLNQFPNVSELTLNIGTEHNHPDDVITLEQIPHIIGLKCPLLERLTIVCRRNCNLWDFAEHLDKIFRLPRLFEYEFEWRGESPGILGFMGNYKSDGTHRRRALQTLRQWSGVVGDSIEVSLFGVKCVCRYPQNECPNPEACETLKGFMKTCRELQIPVTMY